MPPEVDDGTDPKGRVCTLVGRSLLSCQLSAPFKRTQQLLGVTALDTFHARICLDTEEWPEHRSRRRTWTRIFYSCRITGWKHLQTVSSIWRSAGRGAVSTFAFRPSFLWFLLMLLQLPQAAPVNDTASGRAHGTGFVMYHRETHIGFRSVLLMALQEAVDRLPTVASFVTWDAEPGSRICFFQCTRQAAGPLSERSREPAHGHAFAAAVAPGQRGELRSLHRRGQGEDVRKAEHYQRPSFCSSGRR